MENLRAKKAFICDMDGVIYHGNQLIPGVEAFVNWLKREEKEYLFLTNNSSYSPRELREKLLRLGLDIPVEHFYTSALSTARFLAEQKPGGSAYVIGEAGIINALYEAGYSMNDINPDYVVISETRTYNYDTLVKAINLVRGGAKLIGSNPDLTGPAEGGIVPGTGSLVAPIELSTGKKAYFVGKPNPLMMRNAISRIGVKREETIIVGDRMDTDIVAGVEAKIDTVLVLSGVTESKDIETYAYRPTYTLNSVADIPD
jgi:NagD protein